MKVYAVYSIRKSPDYKLEGLFKTKELAKSYIKNSKEPSDKLNSQSIFMENHSQKNEIIYDIQLEEVIE